jgi:Polyketide cyclase / dehydrase and lipid transport
MTRMDLNFFRFRNLWRLEFRPDEVYHALQDIGGYPRWWPEVRSVDRIDDDTVRIVARSFLPYSLTFEATDSRQDDQAGVLEVRMSGDLEGFSRWTLSPQGSGTRAIFEEEVITRKTSLRRLAVVARPFFRLNHSSMMRSGRRGLCVYLAGYRAGSERGRESQGRSSALAE